MGEDDEKEIKNFQPEEAEEDYATEKITENSIEQEQHIDRLNKARGNDLYQKGGEEKGKLAPQVINPATLPLEKRLFMSAHSKEQLQKFGLEQCDGYAGFSKEKGKYIPRYIPFRNGLGGVYLFKKEEGKDEYRLEFYANTKRR